MRFKVYFLGHSLTQEVLKQGGILFLYSRVYVCVRYSDLALFIFLVGWSTIRWSNEGFQPKSEI